VLMICSCCVWRHFAICRASSDGVSRCGSKVRTVVISLLSAVPTSAWTKWGESQKC
jgi:hypothetical protein